MQDLKQSLASIQSDIESLFSSISQELKSTGSFLKSQSQGFTKPLETLEKNLNQMKVQTKSDTDKILAELEKLVS